jgi:hypothetical protein
MPSNKERNMHYAIEADGLVKRFGATLALDGVSSAVETGSALGVLGPSGAGKTTASPSPNARRSRDTSDWSAWISSRGGAPSQMASASLMAVTGRPASNGQPGEQRLQPSSAQLDPPASALRLQGAENGDPHTDQLDSVSQDRSSPSRS